MSDFPHILGSCSRQCSSPGDGGVSTIPNDAVEQVSEFPAGISQEWGPELSSRGFYFYIFTPFYHVTPSRLEAEDCVRHGIMTTVRYRDLVCGEVSTLRSPHAPPRYPRVRFSFVFVGTRFLVALLNWPLVVDFLSSCFVSTFLVRCLFPSMLPRSRSASLVVPIPAVLSFVLSFRRLCVPYIVTPQASALRRSHDGGGGGSAGEQCVSPKRLCPPKTPLVVEGDGASCHR